MDWLFSTTICGNWNTTFEVIDLISNPNYDLWIKTEKGVVHIPGSGRNEFGVIDMDHHDAGAPGA
jgi:hypothetical protein